ncbi:hypothetical protein SEA_MARSHAWN_81 [Mycobacterium phage Marshawn]|uniref:Uncharacterized protein n=1 Tax=Mycobacterium phage Marshawn TaxID=2652423 RepID=A0A5P8D762_9CAUD|nr:hypothetical protein I5H02_gp18 [Mycobacterium phage Marshawn]QFP94867.1 hypothetical protein SEA_MARSHAWN_81 [Mycobacterium phage Marshawn]
MSAPDYRHARDIPDAVMLQAIVDCAAARGGIWATRWDVERALGGLSIDGSVDEVPGVPWKVVIAKARRLIGRGLITGCTCTCRGDYELTAAGREVLGC